MRYRQRQGGCVTSVILSVIFLIVGVGLSIWGWNTLRNAQKSESWPTVNGEITGSYVRTDNDDDGTTYHAEVAYQYVVNDTRYNADTVSFGQYGSSDRSHAGDVVARYAEGDRVTVFYNPEAPETAVLEPGVTWSSYMLLAFGLCFSIVPLFIGLGMLFSRRR
jgi:hypothetical protein